MADTLSDEQYQAIVDAHPGVRLRRVMGPAGEIVLRAPTAIEESTYQSMLFGESMHAGLANRNMLVMLVVHPDKMGFQKMLAQFPGLNMNRSVTQAMRVLRGEVNEEEGK